MIIYNRNSDEVWLSILEASDLLNISLRAVQKNCKLKKYKTKLISGRGGKRYQIALSSLPEHIQEKYRTQNSLPPPVNQNPPPPSFQETPLIEAINTITQSCFIQTNNQTSLYEDYVNSLVLTPSDRAELKSKRGFTDKIIDNYKIKSLKAGHQKETLKALIEKHGKDALEEAGLIYKNGKYRGELVQSLRRNEEGGRTLLIPYLDREGRVYFIKGHKKGSLPEQSVKLYCPKIIRDIPASRIVLAESEFKALACAQLGIPAIGLQGINIWTGRKFFALVEFLSSLDKERKGLELVICFDSEDKGEALHEKYDKYKTSLDAKKKYPSDFWAYILCYRLDKAGFDCKIGRLPEEWRVNGKVDLDQALAQGKGERDFFKVLDNAVPYSSFLNKLEGECKFLVAREIKKYFYNSDFPLRENFNCYEWGTENKDGEVTWVPISNFTLKLCHTIQDPGENTSRIIQFKDGYGLRSRPFEVLAKEISSSSEFKSFCHSKGDYLWTGTQKHLDKLWERLYVMSTGAIIYQPEEIGKLSGNNWLFGDCVAWSNGYCQELTKGIAIRGLTGLRLLQGRSLAPRILTGKKLDIPYFLTLLVKNLGQKALLGIGWLIATLYSDKIFKRERCFPILFLSGRRQSGKNVFGRWIMRLAGFNTEGNSFGISTPKGIQRKMAGLSNLPFWLNEFRNSENKRKIEFLLNVYGRESYIRAETSNDLRTVERDILGTLLISGQETPDDNGVFSRCVIIQFSEKDREEEYFEPVNKLWDSLPDFTLQVLQNYKKIEAEYFDIYPRAKSFFSRATNYDPRVTQNYSIVVTGILALAKVFNYSIEEDKFNKFCINHSLENKLVKDKETEVAELWKSTEVILSEERDNGEKFFQTEGGKIFLWFAALYKKFVETYRRQWGKAPFKEQAIKDYLREEDYFVAMSVVKRIDGKLRRCIVLDEVKFKDCGYSFFSRDYSLED